MEEYEIKTHRLYSYTLSNTMKKLNKMSSKKAIKKKIAHIKYK